jgi:hypothetical protein
MIERPSPWGTLHERDDHQPPTDKTRQTLASTRQTAPPPQAPHPTPPRAHSPKCCCHTPLGRPCRHTRAGNGPAPQIWYTSSQQNSHVRVTKRVRSHTSPHAMLKQRQWLLVNAVKNGYQGQHRACWHTQLGAASQAGSRRGAASAERRLCGWCASRRRGHERPCLRARDAAGQRLAKGMLTRAHTTSQRQWGWGGQGKTAQTHNAPRTQPAPRRCKKRANNGLDAWQHIIPAPAANLAV